MTTSHTTSSHLVGAVVPSASERPSVVELAAIGLLMALMVVPVTMPVAVLRGLIHDRYGVSEFATSLFMSINMIGAVLAAPFMGAIVDRTRNRCFVILAALLLDAVLFWSMTIAPTFPIMMTMRLVEGIAHMTALSASLALIAERFARRGPVMGMAGAGITFGVGVGAPLGGVLGAADPLVPLRIGAVVLLVVSALAVVVLREPVRREAQPSFADVVRLLRDDAVLVLPLAYAFIDRFTTGFFTATFSLYMRRVFDMEPRQIGMLIALFMLPFSLLSYPVGRACERRSRVALLCGGSALYGLATASLGWWPAETLWVLMLLLGTTAAVMFVPSLMLTTELVSPRLRTTALYGFNAAGALGFIAGPLVGGWVTEVVAARSTWHDGYSAAFVVAGLSELACVALTWRPLMRLRAEGRTT